jgi:hypothetical protein
MEQFSDCYWRRVSAVTLDPEDEGHPLSAASLASSRRSSSAPAQVMASPAPVQQPQVEPRRFPRGGRLKDLIAFSRRSRVLVAKLQDWL